MALRHGDFAQFRNFMRLIIHASIRDFTDYYCILAGLWAHQGYLVHIDRAVIYLDHCILT